jgi:tetratricopeptide (TPR) repeat protein
VNADIDSLIRASEDQGLAPAVALAALADLVNESGDAGRLDGIEAALRWGERMRAAVPSDRDQALIHYFTANAHAIRRKLAPSRPPALVWEEPYLGEEIRHLHLAMQSLGWAGLHAYHQCQILTNLGNALSRCGRLVEAIEWYDRALDLDGTFGMAVANRGLVLVSYTNLVHEPSRRNAVMRAARGDLVRSLEHALEGGASEIVRDALARVEARAPEGFPWAQQVPPGTLEDYPANDRPYRHWGLDHRLFLNELNDLGAWPIGARDTLSLPGYVAPLGEGPRFIGFFNQMKQEFVAARWMLYEGLSDEGNYPADAELVLADTMDYPAYSFRTEQVRLAFRSAYSLLDKIAFFLNHYLGLGLPEDKVWFRTIWFETVKPERRLRPAVAKVLNGPLRALSWIAQDLFDPESAYGAALLPDAKHLWEIRRCLEHRYLKVHRDGWDAESSGAVWGDGLRDDLAMSLPRSVFAEKTLRLLKIVRAALMYLAWAVHAEEAARQAARDPADITPPMVLLPLPRPE